MIEKDGKRTVAHRPLDAKWEPAAKTLAAHPDDQRQRADHLARTEAEIDQQLRELALLDPQARRAVIERMTDNQLSTLAARKAR